MSCLIFNKNSIFWAFNHRFFYFFHKKRKKWIQPDKRIKITDKIDAWQPKEIWQKDKGKRVNSQTFEEVKRRDKNKLKAWLDFAIASEGLEVIAARAQAQPDRVNYLAEQIMYGNSGTAADNNYMQGELAELSAILLGRHLTTHERMELEEQVESFMPA